MGYGIRGCARPEQRSPGVSSGQGTAQCSSFMLPDSFHYHQGQFGENLNVLEINQECASMISQANQIKEIPH